MITFEGLSKRFGRKTVLEDVSFRVDPGEIVALAGANGAGKTTIMAIAMGFIRATAGSVRVLGKDPMKRGHLGDVGWMPERPAFPRCFRVRQLIAFQAATMPSWDHDLARDLRDRLDVDLAQHVEKLSRGQIARVALLCALAHRPKLLILDDPTLGLDPRGRRLLLGELLATACEWGAGVLLSTHLLSEADWSLDRVLLLRRGVIEVDETVEHLKARCRRLFLPSGVSPPTQLGVIEDATGLMATTFDSRIWAELQAEAPAARCEPVSLDDIYIGLT